MPVEEGRHRGTLVCVVLKAKNLPNKRSIGKQDPYCVLQLGDELQKTKPDKRGGQHPTWDEQLHFEVYEDMEEATKGSVGQSGTVKGNSRKTPTILKVSCYADDVRDPELIGEGLVDLGTTLKTGEFDEWVTIKSKDRYAGEVYLELTFYSAAAPPKGKKPVTAPSLSGSDTYGGAGTFTEDYEDFGKPNKKGHASIPSHMRQEGSQTSLGGGEGSLNGQHKRMSTSMSQASVGPNSTSDIPTSLRPSSSLANLNVDEYNPPYAPAVLGRVPSPAPSGHASDHRNDPPIATISASQSDTWGYTSGQNHNTHRYHMPEASTSSTLTMRPSDPSEHLWQAMSTMTVTGDKPLPQPGGGPSAASSTPAPPPTQSYIYHDPQHPGAYAAFQGAMPMMNFPPAPSPNSFRAPGPESDNRQTEGQNGNTHIPRPLSTTFHALPPTPASTAPGSSTNQATGVPSVVNAQALYQSIAEPPPSSTTGTSHSPAPAAAPASHHGLPPSNFPPHSTSPAPRPLPSTNAVPYMVPQYGPPPPHTPSPYPTTPMYAQPPGAMTPSPAPPAPTAGMPYQAPYGTYYPPPGPQVHSGWVYAPPPPTAGSTGVPPMGYAPYPAPPPHMMQPGFVPPPQSGTPQPGTAPPVGAGGPANPHMVPYYGHYVPAPPPGYPMYHHSAPPQQ